MRGWQRISMATPACVPSVSAEGSMGAETTITVTKVPTQTGGYDIELRATARQSTK